MSTIEDLFTPARAIGSIAIFVALFTAFGIFLSDPTIDSILTLIIIILTAIAIAGFTGRVWKMLFKGF